MSIIGTKYNPPHWEKLRLYSRRAKGYHNLTPYPAYGFANWKEEDRGPVPRCQPFVRSVVERGARWLFGKPISIKCEDEEVQERANEIWALNRMHRRMTAYAEVGALSGGIVLTFSYDSTKKGKEVSIQCYDAVESCRLYYADDGETLVMLRKQFPCWNQELGKWEWHREDWTDEKRVIYKPQPTGQTGNSSYEDVMYDVGKVDGATWQVENEGPNLFKIIPGVHIKNLDKGAEYGWGDLWGLHQLIDQINFTYSVEHVHNQMSVWPNKVYIDVKPPADAQPIASLPGSIDELESTGDHADVKLLEMSGQTRPHVAEFRKDLIHQFYDSAGSVLIRSEEVTNKGNLTQAVMMQMYKPLVEMTEEKRKTYGEDGIAKLFEVMSIGLKNAKSGDVLAKGADKDFQILWPDYFSLTDDDMKARVEWRAAAVENRFMATERAAREMASDVGVEDLDEYLAEIEKEPEPATEENGGDQNGKTEKE